MDREIRWTEIALSELHSVADYIARESPSVAIQLIHAARESARSIRTFPEAGPMVQEFDDPIIRERYVKRRYRLIYQIGDSAIWIIAFIDSARDLAAFWNRKERGAE